jgi:exonuclease SbcD
MIRLLHTSDWHLGLELGGHERLEEQKLFLAWLLDTCQAQRIDALLVCGDVYDTANPGVAAQRAFAEFLTGFHRRLPAASLVAIAGNHDSASRLELPRPFGEALGSLHLRGLVTDSVHDLLLPLPDAQGRALAWCLAVPFLRSGDLDCRIQGEETPQEAFQRAVAALYAKAAEGIPEAQRHLPVVGLGHLTLAGSARAGSERILIGGVESVPVAALSQACDYVALGHIHRAQTVGSERVRYCGSPYPIDFDEARHPHGVVLVELEAAGTPPRCTFLEHPPAVPFLRFADPPPPWSEVEARIQAFDWNPWQDAPRSLQPLVELRYDARESVAELRRRCEELCAGRPFRLVGAPRAVGTDRTAQEPTSGPSDRLQERDTPRVLLERHWRSRFSEALPAPVAQRFEAALTEVAIEGESA